MAYIAILGYGVVGSGVFRYLRENAELLCSRAGQPVFVKKVLVRRNFQGDPAESFMTRDIEDILTDEAIGCVVESMGGLDPAYTYVKHALMSGKSVITSNKELVAEYGAELLKTAKERNVRFLFEASVGGGTPVIAPLTRNLLTDRVTAVAGVLNGTTNFIISEMADKSREYSEALKEAQSAGYAESNPSADVEGLDTCRKLSILLSLISGKTVDWKAIPTEGITSLTREDFKRAASLGYTVRLLGLGGVSDGRVSAVTAPFFIKPSHPLAAARGAFNSVVFHADWNGQVVFHGQGAGQRPTAAAVVSDIVEAVKRPANDGLDASWSEEKTPIAVSDNNSFGEKILNISGDKYRVYGGGA